MTQKIMIRHAARLGEDRQIADPAVPASMSFSISSGAFVADVPGEA